MESNYNTISSRFRYNYRSNAFIKNITEIKKLLHMKHCYFMLYNLSSNNDNEPNCHEEGF